ncbi:MAG: FlgD immunoglobulin-like domain containing protein [bacterium]
MKFYLILFLILLTGMSIQSLTIYDVQYTPYMSGISPYLDQTVTISGIVTRIFGSYVYMQDDTLPWHGILIYGPSTTCRVGDSITVTGTVDEYNGKTEITDVSSMTINSSDNIMPALKINTGMASQEMYEGLFLQFDNAVVSSILNDREWNIDDGTGPLVIYEDNTYAVTVPFSLGDTLMFIRGVMDEYSGKYELKPYGNSDVLLTLDGSGTAKANPKIAADSTYIGVRVDIIPTVDSLYGWVKYLKVIVPTKVLYDSIFILCDSARVGLDESSVSFDTTSQSTTIEINDIVLLDTIKIYMKNYFFTAADTVKVYSGDDSASLSLLSVLPVISGMPDLTILDIGEVQSTYDGYTSKYNTQSVTIRGVVIGPSSIFTPTSSSTGFWIMDSTGGVNIYSGAEAMNYSYTLGSEMIITGTVEEYNGVTEVKYGSASDIISINDTIASVDAVILSNSQGISELNEGTLVKVNFGKILTTPVDAGSGKNFQVQNGMSVIDVRISEGTGLYDNEIMSQIKSGKLINVTGIAGQYDSESPYTAGYQLLVRFESDLDILENTEDSTFTLRMFPNPVMFDYGQTSRIEVKALNTDRVTVKIFDINGKLIHILAENQPGSTTIMWDGCNYAGKRVDIGAYVVIAFKTDAAGYVKSIAKPLVVSTKLK